MLELGGGVVGEAIRRSSDILLWDLEQEKTLEKGGRQALCCSVLTAVCI